MNGRLVARGALGETTREAMYRLLRRHFAGLDRRGFATDLAGKGWAVLLEDDRGRLLGFTTLQLYRERWAGRSLTVVFSGDTIVDPEGWGTPVLARTWIRSVRALHAAHGEGPLWWLLIVSGYRTYRFLPVFCRRYHAGPPGATGGALGALADHLATRRFGPAYDPGTGIVRLPRPQRLREPLLDVPPGRRGDPAVARFLALNPGHREGDELVCLAELGDANLTRAGLRMLRGGSRCEPVRGR